MVMRIIILLKTRLIITFRDGPACPSPRKRGLSPARVRPQHNFTRPARKTANISKEGLATLPKTPLLGPAVGASVSELDRLSRALLPYPYRHGWAGGQCRILLQAHTLLLQSSCVFSARLKAASIAAPSCRCHIAPSAITDAGLFAMTRKRRAFRTFGPTVARAIAPGPGRASR